MKLVVHTWSVQLRPGLATKWHANCMELVGMNGDEEILRGPVGEARYHEREGAAAVQAVKDFWGKLRRNA